MAAINGGRRFRRTVVPDRLDLRDRPYILPVTTPPPPTANSLKGLQVRPLNQEETSACTGFALAACIAILFQRAGRVDEASVSPFMLYDMARRYDEFPGPVAEDSGSSLRGAMKGWYKHAACASKLWSSLQMPAPSLDPKTDWWLDAPRRPQRRHLKGIEYYRVTRCCRRAPTFSGVYFFLEFISISVMESP